ncbi:MAG: hypothetical protein GX682_06475 [Clostridiaceae bacterium]|nr:hypothetical protein [Clostridiaceae bacterium]
MKPTNKELEIINKLLENELPNKFSKKDSFKISSLTNNNLSKIKYKLLSMEENKLLKILLIVSIIVWVILEEYISK